MQEQLFLYPFHSGEREVTIHLAGAHQIVNAAVALKAAEVLAKRILPLQKRRSSRAWISRPGQAAWNLSMNGPT